MFEPINEAAVSNAAWENISVTEMSSGVIYQDGKAVAAFGVLLHELPKTDDIPRDCYGNDLRADIAGREIARAGRKFANRRRYQRHYQRIAARRARQ
jgi:hypothetical protein